MRRHRCPGGVKVARFPGMSEVSGSNPATAHCFLLIFVVKSLCLPCYSSLLTACTVMRENYVHGLVPYSFLDLNRTSPTSIDTLEIIQYYSPVCTYSRILHEKA